MDNTTTSQYTLEEDESYFLLDQEELDTDREYTGTLPGKVIGYGMSCPRCESRETIFSVGDYLSHLFEDWVCLKCRLIFSPELAWVFNQLRSNDNEELYLNTN
jgi:hypothetical protein